MNFMTEMKVYLYDFLDKDERRRNWNEFLPAELSYENVDYGNDVFSLTNNAGAQIFNALIIVHYTCLDENVNIDDSLINYLNDKKIKLLIVSGGASIGADANNLCTETSSYIRKSFIATPNIGKDSKFQECFKRFWNNYIQFGELEWKLIEPDPYMEALVSAYLLLIAEKTCGKFLLESAEREILFLAADNDMSSIEGQHQQINWEDKDAAIPEIKKCLEKVNQ